MRPVLFVWKGQRFHSYPVCLTLSFLVFAEAMAAQIIARRLPVFWSLAVTGIVLCAGVSGSRLLFVLSRWREYRQRWRRVFARGEAGASMFGGLVPIYAAGALLWWATPLPVGAFLDMVAVAALPALFVGRLGCVLHGCCAGRATTSFLGIRLNPTDPPGMRRWPVAFFEMSSLVALGFPARHLLVVNARPGFSFLALSASYCLLRVLLDSLRAHPAREITISQKVALTITVLNAIALVAMA